MPFAVNSCVWPAVRVGEAGVTAMEVNTAPVQVRVVLPLTPPLVAVINAPPVDKHLAIPLLLPIVATPVLFDVHATEFKFAG